MATRSTMAGVVALAVAASIAIAPAAAGARASGAAAGGGTLTIAFPYQPNTLDPASTGQTITGQIDRNIFDTLTWQTATGRVTPDLATHWSISNGGKTYTFALRHGVTFQDGTPFNAAAVVASFKRIMNPATHAESALGLLGPLVSVKATGTYTVVCTFKSAYAPFLTNLSESILGIQSPTAVHKYGATIGEHPVGTGPFEVVSWTKGSNLVLQRNPAYRWAPPALGRNGPASLARIVYHFVESGQARFDELQTGQAQLVDSTPALYYKTLHGNPAYHQMAVSLGGSGVYAVINNAKFPTDSLAVRQAILYSVDRVGVIKLADLGQYPLNLWPLQRGMLGYTAHLNAPAYPYNPAKAAQILTAAGWKKVNGVWTKGGRKLSLVITTISGVEDLPLLANAIQGYLKKAGMETTLQQMAEPAWVANWEKGLENITPTWFTGVDPDILRETWAGGQFFNWSKYNNATVTQLLNKAETTSDTASRASLYQQAQQIIMSQAATMPLRENDDLVTMTSRLTNVQTSGGAMVFYTASLR
ncbi:MAG TPA: ABC transporter substrate-binding protein [Chloroflexota bacterium]|nr:ABC transporter substrate-binding protein [Chloroflexota bacterium]